MLIQPNSLIQGITLEGFVVNNFAVGEEIVKPKKNTDLIGIVVDFCGSEAPWGGDSARRHFIFSLILKEKNMEATPQKKYKTSCDC